MQIFIELDIEVNEFQYKKKLCKSFFDVWLIVIKKEILMHNMNDTSFEKREIW